MLVCRILIVSIIHFSIFSFNAYSEGVPKLDPYTMQEIVDELKEPKKSDEEVYSIIARKLWGKDYPRLYQLPTGGILAEREELRTLIREVSIRDLISLGRGNFRIFCNVFFDNTELKRLIHESESLRGDERISADVMLWRAQESLLKKIVADRETPFLSRPSRNKMHFSAEEFLHGEISLRQMLIGLPPQLAASAALLHGTLTNMKDQNDLLFVAAFPVVGYFGVQGSLVFSSQLLEAIHLKKQEKQARSNLQRLYPDIYLNPRASRCSKIFKRLFKR